jgi:hypothetical protein
LSAASSTWQRITFGAFLHNKSDFDTQHVSPPFFRPWGRFRPKFRLCGYGGEDEHIINHRTWCAMKLSFEQVLTDVWRQTLVENTKVVVLGADRCPVVQAYPTQAQAIKMAADAYNGTRLTPALKRLLRLWLAWWSSNFLVRLPQGQDAQRVLTQAASIVLNEGHGVFCLSVDDM